MKNPLLSGPLKFGAMGGGLSILMFLITWGMGKNPLIDQKFFDFFLLPIFIFFSMKDFKDYRNGGLLHFWQGMTVGVICYVALSLISAIFILFFLNFIDDQLIGQYIEYGLKMIDLKKEEMVSQMGEETYNTSRSDMLQTSSFVLALDDFFKKCLIGLTLTIPTAVILRRRTL